MKKPTRPSIYGDTDALWFCGRNKPDGIGDELGDWALDVEADLIYVAGKKLYAARLLPKYCKTAKSAKAKGYYWDKKEKRAWKIASKGCRLTPDEMRRVAMGETVTYYSAAPTYSMRALTSFVKRDIRKTS